jgi:hypothetical protein
LADVAQFRNVQSLSLTVCYSLIDVEAFKDIPFLTLNCCLRANNFSCLGAQQFLSFTRCYGLHDKDVEHYGNVVRLEIEECPQITKLGKLNNNRFIRVGYCDNLREVKLSGFNHIHVEITGCPFLCYVNITGKVYILSVTNNRCLIKGLLKNYEHLEAR